MTEPYNSLLVGPNIMEIHTRRSVARNGELVNVTVGGQRLKVATRARSHAPSWRGIEITTEYEGYITCSLLLELLHAEVVRTLQEPGQLN